MYKVFFDSLCIFQSSSLEDVVGFALGLHRSSNVPHSIGVIEVGNLSPTIKFVRKAKSEENDAVLS